MQFRDHREAVLKYEKQCNAVTCNKNCNDEPTLQTRGGVNRIELTINHDEHANPNLVIFLRTLINE